MQDKKHKRLLIISALIVVFMFGFCFALVPLYNVFCKVTGINGKTSAQAESYTVAETAIDKSRIVTVEFVATRNEALPWKFYPLQTKVEMHPGEQKKIAYFAMNNSPKTMTIQAIPSVTPGVAAQYLKKTECFCFRQQTFRSGESMTMPVVFHIDPNLPKDISVITLSYTIFDISKTKKG